MYNFSEQSLSQLRMLADQLIDVDAKIGNVAPHRTKRDMGIEKEVALAEFDKASERTQALHSSDHRLAGDRVEDNIDAFAASEAADFIAKSEGAGVADQVGSIAAKEGTLFLASGSSDDGRAPVPRHLKGGDPYTAGCTVYEDDVALLELPEMD